MRRKRIHLVLDNLNTHFRKCLEDVRGKCPAAQLLRRVVFHYTPKHASWLNMAEIEIGILSRQCLSHRVQNRESLEREFDAWQRIEANSNELSSGRPRGKMQTASSASPCF
ncbi:MAG TPA: transposase [Polaromonas sp.]|nr:transposase [Polaromonas sp.]